MELEHRVLPPGEKTTIPYGEMIRNVVLDREGTYHILLADDEEYPKKK